MLTQSETQKGLVDTVTASHFLDESIIIVLLIQQFPGLVKGLDVDFNSGIGFEPGHKHFHQILHNDFFVFFF